MIIHPYWHYLRRALALLVLGMILQTPLVSSLPVSTGSAQAASSKSKAALHLYRRAKADFDNWNLDEAVDLASQALKLVPDMQEALALRGAVYCERGWAYGNKDDIALAIVDLNNAIALNSKDAVSLRFRGIAYRELDNNAAALVDLKLSLSLVPAAETAGALADTYVDMEQSQLAISAYELAMQFDPKSPVYPLGRGEVRAEAGEFEAAIDDYTLALKLDPRYSIAYQYRSLARFVLGHIPEALNDINKALKLSPEDAGSLYYRGMIELGAGDVRHADESFRRALKSCEDCVTYRVFAVVTGRRLGIQDTITTYFPDKPQDEWPAPMISYFQQRSSFEDVLKAATVPGRFNGAASQTCDAYFIAGEWKLAVGDTASATVFLNKALELCSKDWISWPAARDELARVK